MFSKRNRCFFSDTQFRQHQKELPKPHLSPCRFMAWTYYRGCRRLANPDEAAIRLSAERADRITCKASGSDGITSTTGLRARR
ncbi:MAG: hypothetical protein KDB05_21370, partial [Planctomycetales bacterium]|nr:hypothetical protein [Planctomycetales bacterium]